MSKNHYEYQHDVTKQEITKQEKALQKQREKEEAAKKRYANSMVTRAEAYQMAQTAAEFITEQRLANLQTFLREPLMANIAQSMALSELLIRKGIITADELQTSLDEVYLKLNPSEESGTDGQSENKGGSGEHAEETEEQQG